MLNTQKQLFNILLSTKTLLDEIKIKWWIDYGTLLGAVRKKEIIPWDNDCDVCCIEKDIPKINSLMLKFKERQLELYTGAFSNTGFQVYPKPKFKTIHLDIFSWYLDGEILRRKFYVGMNQEHGTDRRKGRDFPAIWISELSEISIFGIKFPAPANPIAFCKFRYGDSWQTPLKIGQFNKNASKRKDEY